VKKTGCPGFNCGSNYLSKSTYGQFDYGYLDKDSNVLVSAAAGVCLGVPTNAVFSQVWHRDVPWTGKGKATGDYYFAQCRLTCCPGGTSLVLEWNYSDASIMTSGTILSGTFQGIQQNLFYCWTIGGMANTQINCAAYIYNNECGFFQMTWYAGADRSRFVFQTSDAGGCIFGADDPTDWNSPQRAVDYGTVNSFNYRLRCVQGAAPTSFWWCAAQ